MPLAAPPQVVPTPTADPDAPARTDAPDPLTGYRWEPQPEAEAFVKNVVEDFLARLPEAKAFAERLYRETGNRFADLIDFILLHEDTPYHAAAVAAGWEEFDDDTSHLLFRNSTGIFPLVATSISNDTECLKIGIKVESVIDFFAAIGKTPDLTHYDPADIYHSFIAWTDDFTTLRVVERHGNPPSIVGGDRDPVKLNDFTFVRNALRVRPRFFPSDSEAFDHIDRLVDDAIGRVGRDVACDLFFAAEREYWQKRNRAAQYQKARQDKLGIGWANHDHHTYRSSRANFHRLCGLWETLGFHCRERFYPGKHAGWGAQVMEQPVCGIVTFNDVDLSPEELRNDFAHEPMEDRKKLGTVGMWCALHGDSVLQAGMHHLECTFDFDALQRQMADEAGIKTMKAFTDFPHLKQAFTEGERWKVDPKRIDALLADGRIDPAMAETFRRDGAIGSHLENLERNAGFKGFNQTGVDEIIAETDPRLQAGK